MKALKTTLTSLVLAACGCNDVVVTKQLVSSNANKPVSQSSPLSFDISFTTKQNLNYNFEVLAYRKGIIVLDPVFQRYSDQMHFYEAGPVNRFRNVNIGDFVVLTDKQQEFTHVMRYFGINTLTQEVTFEDTAIPGVLQTIPYNSTTRVGKVQLNGKSFAFIVERSPPYRLGFDNNGDGQFDGDDQAPIVKSDGSKILEEHLLPK